MDLQEVCKKLNLDYVSAARAGLLHDFFTNNYKEEKAGKLMKEHPIIASICQFSCCQLRCSNQ